MRNFNNLVNRDSLVSHRRSVARRVVPNIKLNDVGKPNATSPNSIKDVIKDQENKGILEWEERNIGYNPPSMTVGIIDHNMKEKVWMALESLKNQLNIIFPWELIIIEEDGSSRDIVKDYIGLLPGCVRVLYKTILPGSGKFISSVLKTYGIDGQYTCMEKFCDVMKLAHQNSNIFVKQEAGSFSPHNRLYNHFIQFRDGECLVSTQLKGYIYDIVEDKFGCYDGNNIEPYSWDARVSELIGGIRPAHDNPEVKMRATHLNMAYRLSHIRHIPLLERPIPEKDLNDIIFIAMFASSNRRPEETSMVRHDVEISDGSWKSGISILQGCQPHREKCVQYIEYPNDSVPEYVVDRLRSMHCKEQSLVLSKRVSQLQSKRDRAKKVMETREREQLEILKQKQQLADVLEKRIDEEKALMKIHMEQQSKIDMQQTALTKAKEYREMQEKQIVDQNSALQRQLQEEAIRIEKETERLNQHAIELKRDRLREEALVDKRKRETERLQKEQRILEDTRVARIMEEEKMMKEADNLQLRSIEDIIEVEKAAKEMKDKIARLEEEQKKEKLAMLAREEEYARLKEQEKEFEIAQKKRAYQEQLVMKEKEALRKRLEESSNKIGEDTKILNNKLKEIQVAKAIEEKNIALKKAERDKVKKEENELEKLLKARVKQEEALLKLEKEKIRQQEEDLALARIRHGNHEKMLEDQQATAIEKAKSDMKNSQLLSIKSSEMAKNTDHNIEFKQLASKKEVDLYLSIRNKDLNSIELVRYAHLNTNLRNIQSMDYFTGFIVVDEEVYLNTDTDKIPIFVKPKMFRYEKENLDVVYNEYFKDPKQLEHYIAFLGIKLQELILANENRLTNFNNFVTIYNTLRNTDRGIMFICFGEGYNNICLSVIRSYRQHTDLPILLYTDSTKYDNEDHQISDLYIIHIDEDFMYSRIIKTQAYKYSPFRNTCYVDIDSECLQNFDHIYDHLATYDICMQRNLEQISKKFYTDRSSKVSKQKPVGQNVSHAKVHLDYMDKLEKCGEWKFSELKFDVYAGGLVFFSKTSKTKELFDNVSYYWNKCDRLLDMIGWTIAIYSCNPNIYRLPSSDYNGVDSKVIKSLHWHNAVSDTVNADAFIKKRYHPLTNSWQDANYNNVFLKKTIVICYDVDGWVLHEISLLLQRYLADEYIVVLLNEVDASKTPDYEYDMILFLNLTPFIANSFDHVNIKKVVLGRTSHSWATERCKKYWDMLKKCNVIHANTKSLCHEINKYISGKLFYLPNGIDIDRFYRTTDVSISKSVRVSMICSEGRKKAKGLQQYLDVINYLRSKNVTVEDKKLIMKPGSKVIANRELNRYYNNVDILICLSESETGPQPCFEALACGRIIITTKVGLIRDVIKEGYNGYEVEDRNDIVTIGNKIIRYLLLPDRNKREMSNNCIESIIDYDWKKQVLNYEKMIEYHFRSV